jgi:hypothetical protein
MYLCTSPTSKYAPSLPPPSTPFTLHHLYLVKPLSRPPRLKTPRPQEPPRPKNPQDPEDARATQYAPRVRDSGSEPEPEPEPEPEQPPIAGRHTKNASRHSSFLIVQSSRRGKPLARSICIGCFAFPKN